MLTVDESSPHVLDVIAGWTWRFILCCYVFYELNQLTEINGDGYNHSVWSGAVAQISRKCVTKIKLGYSWSMLIFELGV